MILDNLIAEGKAVPFMIVMANSYVPGGARAGRRPRPKRVRRLRRTRPLSLRLQGAVAARSTSVRLNMF